MSAHQVGTMLLALAVVIALARLLGAAAKRVGQPPVIGEILAGILVGPTFFGTAVSDVLFPRDRTSTAQRTRSFLLICVFAVIIRSRQCP